MKGVTEENSPEEYEVSKAVLEEATAPGSAITSVELDRLIRQRKLMCKLVEKHARPAVLAHLAALLKELYAK